ncbi:hypothetical protein L873DRAFT_1847389 [Choiromyces venosus 120613-1]|uniref:Uncharacterized protein n=1 Tax=Choiromyces venosus 120613-1 TaxID=1336337 RepID=A0A3N4J7X1_9PEZI|nr:hypothetical protein L873DRAFT_1847389 [Choiromyces venosus 120613-1]
MPSVKWQVELTYHATNSVLEAQHTHGDVRDAKDIVGVLLELKIWWRDMRVQWTISLHVSMGVPPLRGGRMALAQNSGVEVERRRWVGHSITQYSNFKKGCQLSLYFMGMSMPEYVDGKGQPANSLSTSGTV